MHEDGAEEEDPVTQSIEPGERHVPGADGQWDYEVKETDRQRHDYHEHHHRGVHGEHLVESSSADQVVVGRGQLHADDAGFQACNQQEDESGLRHKALRCAYGRL